MKSVHSSPTLNWLKHTSQAVCFVEALVAVPVASQLRDHLVAQYASLNEELPISTIICLQHGVTLVLMCSISALVIVVAKDFSTTDRRAQLWLNIVIAAFILVPLVLVRYAMLLPMRYPGMTNLS